MTAPPARRTASLLTPAPAARQAAGAAAPQTIAVGICTYRRAHLGQTLASVAGQVLPPGVALHILVADNDATPTASAAVQSFAGKWTGAVTHLHCPAANISLARNAVLDAAERFGLDRVAFLDDDEIACPGWIAALLERQRETGAEAVLGPVLGVYGAEAPRWMVAAAMHDTRPETSADGRPDMGYTGNVLLDLSAPALRGLRFDLARGRSGGEDTAYFHQIRRRGAHLAYAPDAVAEEEVPAPRARAGWLVQRRFRMGQTHASLGHPAPLGRRLGWAALALAKAGAATAMVVPRLPFAAGRTRAVMRVALHLGAVSAHLGARRLEPYAPPAALPTDAHGEVRP